jgi:hypothetical protein
MQHMTPTDNLRHATVTIRRAATGIATANPFDVAAAHNQLALGRHATAGAVRDAIDHYLDDDTWHRGPLAILAAITHLAHQLDIPNPDTGHITEQATLFDLDHPVPSG